MVAGLVGDSLVGLHRWPGVWLAVGRAVEAEGYAEHDGEQERELRLGDVAEAQVDERIGGPDDAAGGPNPCSASHI